MPRGWGWRLTVCPNQRFGSPPWDCVRDGIVGASLRSTRAGQEIEDSVSCQIYFVLRLLAWVWKEYRLPTQAGVSRGVIEHPMGERASKLRVFAGYLFLNLPMIHFPL